MSQAQNRLARLTAQLAPPPASPLPASPSPCAAAAASPKHDDDVVVIAAVRTPMCKAKRGALKDVHAADLLVAALKGVVARGGIDAKHVDDVCVGNVLAPGAFSTPARMAALTAGLPHTTAVHTVNRQCSSSLQAVGTIAAAIKAGQIDVGIAAGVESMSGTPMGPAAVGSLAGEVLDHAEARDCLIPMGITSENVAERYGVTRHEQDSLAAESHRRASAAWAAGRFDDEIVAVGDVRRDDGMRPETTVESLSKLRAVFKPDGGSTTAGNASQVSDGAAAVLLSSRRRARELGLRPLATVRSFAVAGVPPDVMGIGPAVAVPAALAKARVALRDVGLFEINEAFASQAVYCCKKLQLDMQRVNVNGGAIAIGHPLGATGARQTATLLSEMRRRNERFGVVSMCIGTGMGAAAVYELE